jgi:hypothetical protein
MKKSATKQDPQSKHSMEVGEQISIMPLEDKDHRGGI